MNLTSLLLAVLMLLSSLTSHGQTNDIFSVDEIEIGKTVQGMPAIAKHFKSKYTITGCYYDHKRGHLLLLLNKLIKLGNNVAPSDKYVSLLFDIHNYKTYWINETQSTWGIYHLCGSNTFIIYKPQKKSICYNIATGDVLWEHKEKIQFLDERYNIAITSKGEALDLTTGKSLWEYKIDDQVGWNNLVYLNDTTILLAANGIYCINILNGKGWHHPATTWSTFGAMQGNIMRGICSNILVAGNDIYWASKKAFTRYDLEGKIIWEKELPRDSISNIDIAMDKSNSNIIFYNTGYAYEAVAGYGWSIHSPIFLSEHHVNQKYGKPFLASYNTLTGKPNYTMSIPHKGLTFQNHFTEDHLLINAPKKIYKYDVTTGKTILEKEKKNTMLEQYPSMTENYYGVLPAKANQYKPLSELYPGNIFFVGENEQILRTNEAFEPIDTLATNSTWRILNEQGDFTFLDAIGKQHIIRDNKKLITLKLKNPLLLSDKLIDINDGLRIIDTAVLFH